MTPTPKQRAALAALVELKSALGYPPTLRELADRLGVCVNDVRQKLRRLEKCGLIERRPGAARGVVVVGEVRA